MMIPPTELEQRAVLARAGTIARAAAMALLAATATVVAAPAARAQARPEEQPGDLKMLPDVWGADGSRIPATVRAQERATVSRLFALLGRNPALASPRGYLVRTYEIYNHLAPDSAGVSTSYGLGVILIPWQVDENGKLFHRQNTSPSDFLLLVNDIGCVAQPFLRDAAGRIYALGDVAPDAYGRDAGDDAVSHRCVLIARGDRPLWLPVSKERFLTAAIRQARAGQDTIVRQMAAATQPVKAPSLADPEIRKTYDAYRKTDPKLAQAYLDALAEAQKGMAEDQGGHTADVAKVASQADDFAAQRVRAFEAELAALSPGERAQPAWAVRDWYRSLGPVLARPGAEGAAQLVLLNREYFDRALPPATPQLITIRTPADDQGGTWMSAIWKEMARSELRAMLRR